MHVVELAPRMSPAGREIDAAAEPLEAGIAVDLQNAPELRKVGDRAFGLTIGTIEIECSRRIGALPGTIIAKPSSRLVKAGGRAKPLIPTQFAFERTGQHAQRRFWPADHP